MESSNFHRLSKIGRGYEQLLRRVNDCSRSLLNMSTHFNGWLNTEQLLLRVNDCSRSLKNRVNDSSIVLVRPLSLCSHPWTGVNDCSIVLVQSSMNRVNDCSIVLVQSSMNRGQWLLHCPCAVIHEQRPMTAPLSLCSHPWTGSMTAPLSLCSHPWGGGASQLGATNQKPARCKGRSYMQRRMWCCLPTGHN